MVFRRTAHRGNRVKRTRNARKAKKNVKRTKNARRGKNVRRMRKTLKRRNRRVQRGGGSVEELFEAVEYGQVERVKELLDAGTPIDELIKDEENPYKDGASLIWLASYNDRPEILKMLINAHKKTGNLKTYVNKPLHMSKIETPLRAVVESHADLETKKAMIRDLILAGANTKDFETHWKELPSFTMIRRYSAEGQQIMDAVNAAEKEKLESVEINRKPMVELLGNLWGSRPKAEQF